MPASAFPPLRRLGLLEENRAKLLPAIWLFIQPQFDAITKGLRHLLGPDLSGPEWLVCHCRRCQKRAADIDHTRPPGRNPMDAIQAEEAIRKYRSEKRARKVYETVT